MFHSISDDIIKWVPYSRDEIVCNRYPLDVWHKAVHDIHSDEDWANFLEGSTIVKCYILKLCNNNESIAFLYTLQENIKGDIVSVHGGGWKYSLMYHRGYMLMLKNLLDRGLKVRTYCQLDNPKAIRFSRSVGFVPYKYTDEEVFMWITEKRLKGCKFYHRFFK